MASNNEASSSSSSVNTSNIASSLCDKTSVHSSLMKLFKPVSEGFNPSSVASSISHGHKRSLKLSRARGKESTDTVKTTQRKETKPITVILLSDNVYVVPKDKKKLREEQRMNC